MPDSVVVVGVPVDLEERKYTLKNGDRAGEEETSLSFRLLHPLTAVSGSCPFEATSPRIIEAIREAHAQGFEVQIAARPIPIRSDKVDKFGKPRDWVKLRALAVS